MSLYFMPMGMGRLFNVAPYRLNLLTYRLCRYSRAARLDLNTAARDHSVWNRAYATHNWYTMRINVTMAVVRGAQCEGAAGAATTLPIYRSCGSSLSSGIRTSIYEGGGVHYFAGRHVSKKLCAL